MPRSFQAPERIGAREQELLGEAARLAALNATMAGLEQIEAEIGREVQPLVEAGNAVLARAKGTTDHDGDGKMGGVKGRKPKAKK